MDLKVRKHIYFYGRVQGVGFRYYAVQKAGQLGLAGWVRNRYDGSVEMEVEGAETDIDQMILFLKNRTYIWIEDMRVKSMSLEGEYGFYEREDE
ncbi:acylphosphatase [Blautia sp. MCC289]|nr:acylphosphatase [Blautia sp. MCC289]